MQKYIIYFTLVLVLVSVADAQTDHEDISQILQAFQQLDYKIAKQKAEKVLQTWQQYSLTELVEVHKILGVINYSEGNLVEAQSQFERALSLDAATQLDSVLISPKIISYFNKIKASYEPQQQTSPTTQLQYIIVPDPIPNATLRSLIVPGWGQIHKDQKNKGIALLIATGVSLTSWGTFYVLQQKAHDDYQNAKTPKEIEDNYNKYNQFYKTQQVCGYITGAFWLYSLLDAFITKPNVPESDVSFRPQITDDYFVVTAVWYF